jgi:hypothetical protein
MSLNDRERAGAFRLFAEAGMESSPQKGAFRLFVVTGWKSTMRENRSQALRDRRKTATSFQ